VTPRDSALAPFRVRSFRYQWPSDLGTSWAFEMETLILGWYILVETHSVFLLTVFGSVQWMGTLISPLFGVAGDRIGHRNVLCAMRIFYTAQALVIMGLALSGTLDPIYVLAISTLTGMVRPSDMVLRNALVGETVPSAQLIGAMSFERATSDSARVVGALTGAGLAGWLGIGAAYAVIVLFYVGSLLLTLGIARKPQLPQDPSVSARISPWRDLRDGVAYVWSTPLVLAAMWLAFLVNVTAYPLVLGLLPHVAKETFQTDQAGLSYLMAGVAAGALFGSIFLTHPGSGIRAGRWMVISCAAWYVALATFALQQHLAAGVVMLVAAGIAQSFGLVPMAALLMRNTDPRFRGRIMGVRMFAIYGLPIGLLLAGPIVERYGFLLLAMLYCAIGLVCTVWITVRWRGELWRKDAPANRP
jgi:MFS family permease